MELTDFPYSGTKRPFDWFIEEPKGEAVPSHYLCSELVEEAQADLQICIGLYLSQRMPLYINYMRGAKNLFAIFFPATHPLKDMCPYWEEEMTEFLHLGNQAGEMWSPSYEIQRLWVATKIHWSWLEWAWIQVQDRIVRDNTWVVDHLRGKGMNHYPFIREPRKLVTYND